MANELVDVNGKVLVTQEAVQAIVDIEKKIAELKKVQDTYKEELKAAMENNDIIKFDNDLLTVTYVAETTAERLDSKALKAECPDVYNAYCKISKVKASIRLKVKE